MNDYDIIELLGEQYQYLLDPNDSHGAPDAIRALVRSLIDRERCPPIDMVLRCPVCGVRHVDAPSDDAYDGNPPTWTNPPHRSHLCHECGHVWRPADVPTNGVEAVKTKGKNDSPLAWSAGPMAPPNRRVAYSACDLLRSSGYRWNDGLKAWTK